MDMRCNKGGSIWLFDFFRNKFGTISELNFSVSKVFPADLTGALIKKAGKGWKSFILQQTYYFKTTTPAGTPHAKWKASLESRHKVHNNDP